jgi:hypothetical protein
MRHGTLFAAAQRLVLAAFTAMRKPLQNGSGECQGTRMNRDLIYE